MRVYTVECPAQTWSGASPITMLSMVAPATCVLRLLDFEISQQSSEVSENVEFTLWRYDASGAGTAGGTWTATKTETGDPAAAGTYKYKYTAEPTTFDGTEMKRFGFNLINGYYYAPPERAPIYVPPSKGLAIRSAVTPSTSYTLTITATVGEIG